MEGEYDLPMRFDESLVPDSPAAAGEKLESGGMEWQSMGHPGGIVESRRPPH